MQTLQSARKYELPTDFPQVIDHLMQGTGYDHTHAKRLAEHVKHLSNHYHKKSEVRSEFWDHKPMRAGYFSYFFPLAFIRTISVFKEALRLGFLQDYNQWVDFGSGAGTLNYVANNLDLKKNPELLCVEINKTAMDLHKSWLDLTHQQHPRWISTDQALADTAKLTGNKRLGVFSYVLNELETAPDFLFDFDGLVLIEPSTHKDSRELLKLRAKLIEKGFYIWGPCTHQDACPLLSKTKTDWCHDRVYFERPLWFRNLENMVEIVNRSVTYSYILARKTPPPWGAVKKHEKLARITGDTLNEKGKTRQAVCRGSDREFLSWLKKEGPTPFYPHGAMVEMPEEIEVKGNELRVGDGVKLIPWDTPAF